MTRFDRYLSTLRHQQINTSPYEEKTPRSSSTRLNVKQNSDSGGNSTASSFRYSKRKKSRHSRWSKRRYLPRWHIYHTPDVFDSWNYGHFIFHESYELKGLLKLLKTYFPSLQPRMEWIKGPAVGPPHQAPCVLPFKSVMLKVFLWKASAIQ